MEAANELCKCDKHVNIVEKFIPYSFATINPYRKSETRMDGTPCECDEFPFSHLFRKQFRIGDKSCFDNTATVKLPPYWIEWRQRPMQLTENRLTWPKALPLNKSVSDGVLNYNRRPEKVLKHEISLKYYTPPNAQYVKMIYN